MRLDQIHTPEGEPFTKSLERVLIALAEDDEAVSELYQSLWDIHDGAARLIPAIQELARVDPQANTARATRLLFQIYAELYEHLEGHLQTLKPVLSRTTDKLVGEK